MTTIASGSTSYAVLTDLTNRYDIRPVQELMSDTGTPIAQNALPTTAALTAILQEASGIVEAYATAGGRYQINGTTNDLQTIYTSSTNTAQFLIGLVCAIAWWKIWSRRPEWIGGRPDAPPFEVKEAFDWLEKLSQGHIIFGTVEAEQAGNMNDESAESTAEIQNVRLITTVGRALYGPRVRDIVGANPPKQAYP